jgi:hypothetical protein
LRGLELDAAESLAQLAQEHVLHQAGRDLVLAEKTVQLLHLKSIYHDF